MSDLISNMKERIKSSGSSRKEVFYVGADSKRRVRFLQELDDGYEFTFHSHWEKGVNALCPDQLGKDCPYCNSSDEGMKTITMYGWSVWDSDANAVRILLYKATGITPIPQLIEFHDEYGTIMDRDYTIKKVGKGVSGSITVVPGEISKFRNTKAKPYSQKQMLKLLAKSFPVNESDADDEDEDEDEVPVKKSGKKAANGREAKKSAKKDTKKKKKTIGEKLMELSLDELRDIAIELGINKKELKKVDEEEIVEMLASDYEEEDLEEAYESYIESQEDNDDDEEDDEDDEEDDDEDDE